MAVAAGRRRTLDRPPRAPDMNPVENMWSELKRTMQEKWPVLPLRTSDEQWTLVSVRGMKLLRLSVSFEHRLSP